VPFKEGHGIVGNLVQACEARGCTLEQLSDAELAAVDPRLTPEVRAVLEVRQALDARCGCGGTAPVRVKEQLTALAARVAGFAEWVKLPAE